MIHTFLTEGLSFDTWLTPVISIIVSAVISAIVGGVVKNTLEKYFRKRDEEEKKIHEEHEELTKMRMKEDQSRLNETIKTSVDSSLIAVKEQIEILNKNIETLNSELSEDRKGTVTLLRDRMKSSMDEYKQKGYANDADRANWNELYKTYKSLGGNHFKEYVNQWKETVDNLPTKDK